MNLSSRYQSVPAPTAAHRARSSRDRVLGRAAGALLVTALLHAWISPASATLTDPALALTDARAVVGSTRVQVQLEGGFPQQELVQIPYPLQLLIRGGAGGTQYLRFDLSAGAFDGSFAGLADGLDSSEAITLLGEGTPTLEARTTLLATGRIDVSFPATFPRTNLRAQLFIQDQGSGILSNEIPVVIVVGGP